MHLNLHVCTIETGFRPVVVLGPIFAPMSHLVPGAFLKVIVIACYIINNAMIFGSKSRSALGVQSKCACYRICNR
jgi:hypothetical protein